MTKNLMTEVLKQLGVDYGERFKLRENGKKELRDEVYCFVKDFGLLRLTPEGKSYHAYAMLEELLFGYYKIVKLPWQPQIHELYYAPSTRQKKVEFRTWGECTTDWALLALGMVYRTEEEAKANFKSDYEKLTGEKLEQENL